MSNFFKAVSRSLWILLAIIVVGVFLRSYQFHDRLDLGSDQINDAVRVGQVVDGKAPWPLLGPDMSKSGSGGRESRFRLGPMYYYFEITSAKIFGNTPDAMAYPDLFFSILSLPLFYYFLRQYFRQGLSLALLALYATSFYILWFSHSAWNPNSIPFFSLLLLLALLEFLVRKKDVAYGWVVALGVALGVGVQLHAILLILFPVVTLCVFIFTTWHERRGLWLKWAAVLLLVLLLNFGQIKSEWQTNFKNSKTFFSSVTGASKTDTGQSLLPIKFSQVVDCTLEANAYILSSVGDKDCNFALSDIFTTNLHKWVKSNLTQPAFVLQWFFIILFSFFGYGMLYRLAKNEADERKRYFLRLMSLYLIVSLFVFLPVVSGAMRYFVHLFFLPLFFCGFFVDYLSLRFPEKYLRLVVPACILIVLINLYSLQAVINGVHVEGRIVLGELDQMLAYVSEEAPLEKEVYILVEKRYIQDYYKSLAYVAGKKGIVFVRALNYTQVPVGKPVFTMQMSPDGTPGSAIDGHNVRSYRDFDVLAMYSLENGQ